jgi:hypothetical protein
MTDSIRQGRWTRRELLRWAGAGAAAGSASAKPSTLSSRPVHPLDACWDLPSSAPQPRLAVIESVVSTSGRLPDLTAVVDAAEAADAVVQIADRVTQTAEGLLDHGPPAALLIAGLRLSESAAQNQDPVAGAGQGDIEQAPLFSQQGLALVLLVLFKLGRAQVEHGLVVAVGIGEEEQLLVGGVELDGVEQEGAEDHRILEPLALVGRHHLHRLVVALQADLGGGGVGPCTSARGGDGKSAAGAGGGGGGSVGAA